MPHYLRQLGQFAPQLWYVGEGRAVGLGVQNPERGPNHHVAADGDIWAVLRAVHPASFAPEPVSPFEALSLEPGGYYRRMARKHVHAMGMVSNSPAIPEEDVAFAAIARGQLDALLGQLMAICRTIHPAGDNLNAYGHDTRNILILACTEVEMLLKGVLLNNGVPAGRLNIKHYAHASAPLKLPEYELSFRAFPWLPAFRPFGTFGTGADQTHSLDWYQAYNGVKHNREGEFASATLGHAFSALAACVILLVAQFGLNQALDKGSELYRAFGFGDLPEFAPGDWYFAPTGEGGADAWAAVPYPFQIPL